MNYITVTLTRAQADALGYATHAARREIGTPTSHFDRNTIEALRTRFSAPGRHNA